MPLTILLQCHDLDTTRQFYRALPGFDVRDTADGTVTAELHGGVLIFTNDDLLESPPVFSGTIYFSVPDVDAYFTSIQDRVDIAWPLQDMSYGSREFGIRDSDGYHLAFRQQG